MGRRRPEFGILEDSADWQQPSGPPVAGEDEVDGLAADHHVVQRCVAGEVAAWEELYGQCHDPLLALIRGLLNGCANSGDLADEISARVWYALVANEGQLLSKYDPQRGARLLTFMVALAKDLVCRHFRSERRRAERELVAAQERPAHHSDDLDQSESFLEEFLGTLNAEERQFLNDYLLENPADVAKGDGRHLPRTTVWQRTRRLYKQMVRFLGR
jgi:DNA-directed RNA polymerase specialized sigma24 family protein